MDDAEIARLTRNANDAQVRFQNHLRLMEACGGEDARRRFEPRYQDLKRQRDEAHAILQAARAK